MSNNASVAAAQRRRANKSQNTRFVKPQNRNEITEEQLEYNNLNIPTRPIFKLNDILQMQSKQIHTLKKLTDKHDEHWNENDEMLKEICMRVDNVEALGEMYNSLLDRIILIEEKLNIKHDNYDDNDNNDDNEHDNNNKKYELSSNFEKNENVENTNNESNENETEKVTSKMLLDIQEKIKINPNDRLGIKKGKNKK